MLRRMGTWEHWAKIVQIQCFWSTLTKTIFFRSKPSFFRSKSTKTSLFGQNRPKPVFSRSKLTKTSFFGQNPVFPVKIDENKFCSQNRLKQVFPVKTKFFRPKSIKNQFSWSKSIKTSFVAQTPVLHLYRTKLIFFGPNRPKPVFLAKINQNQISRQKSTET